MISNLLVCFIFLIGCVSRKDISEKIQPESISENNIVNLSDDKVNFYKLYSFPAADGTADQVLKTDGSGNLTWTTVSGASLTNSANADSTTTVSNSNATTIDSFPHATFRGGRYVVSLTADHGGGDIKYETHDLLVTHDGTTGYFTQNSLKSHTGSDMTTFSVGINGSNFELKVVNGGANSITYKVYRNLLNV